MVNVLLVGLCLVPGAPQPPAHSTPFWRAIVSQKFELPAGESAPALAAELVRALGAPDAELRDELAFTILTAWIYDKKLLGPDDLRPLVRTLQGNLKQGVVQPGTDEVLLRSFSALTLSVVAARDNVTPFLSSGEYAGLLDAGLAYFHDERDTRGFDPQKGWIHTAAHTADLLKFLARNPKLPAAGQARLLDALTAKNRDAGSAYAQGEDERMARVVISIVRRPDFDRESFRAWLASAQAAATFPKQPSVDALRAHQNVRHLLSALWTELSADERPSEGAAFARDALRETIKTLF